MFNHTNNISRTDKAKENSKSTLNENLQKDFDEKNKEKVTIQLLKESDHYKNNSNQKAEQAREYLSAAKSMESMAETIRSKAKMLRDGGPNAIKKKEAIKEITNMVKSMLDLTVPVPKDATPEKLEKMADDIEARAKHLRLKADDLLKDSENDMDLSKQLKKQADSLDRKEMRLNDVQLKAFAAHNEGLSKVFKMLGIMRLDSIYKDQLAIAEKNGNQLR